MIRKQTLALILLLTSLNLVCSHPGAGALTAGDDQPEKIAYEVVQTYPHDRAAFTQGLIFSDGFLYESTGQHGQSGLRKVDIQSGKVLESRKLPSILFGEGLTLFRGKLYQLTWYTGILFIYERDNFAASRTIRYSQPREGWGLTNNGTQLIASDGSPTLYFMDPASLTVKRRLLVREMGNPVYNINELEYIQGKIYANIWQKNRIIRINPRNGVVDGWLDLASLVPEEVKGEEESVLNGIAYDPRTDLIYVTGKMWPRLYTIKLVKDGTGKRR